jgi:membrane protease YdiL (CAAX protease family)
MQRALVSTGLLAGGLAIFVLGSPYYSVWATNGNQIYALALTAVLLGMSLALRRHPGLSRYARAVYALFVASAALLFLNTGLLNVRVVAPTPLQDIALDKLSQFLHVVPVILVLTWAAGDGWSSLLLRPGRVKAGLLFGGVSFVVWAALAYAVQAGAEGFPRLDARAAGYLLVFVACNALMEELWFRGIFLRRYEAAVGRAAAIAVTSAVFGASHVNATYAFPGGGAVLGGVVCLLGAVSAYSMFKTESALGAVLFHAGYDLMIIVPVLNAA